MRAWLRDLPDRHDAAFWTLMLALLLAMALVTIEAASYPPVKPAAVAAIVASSMIGASLWGAAVYRARRQRAVAALMRRYGVGEREAEALRTAGMHREPG